MDKKQELKRSILNKVKSMEKANGIKLSVPKLKNQSQSPSFSRSQKKLIQAQAKEVKNKIGRFLQKLKTKADGFLKSSQQYGLNQPKQQYVQQSSVTSDPYQFRKKNTIILQKGLKKSEKYNPIVSINQYYDTDYKQGEKIYINQLHPLTKNLKNYSDTVTTSSSNKKQHKQLKLQDFQIGRKLGSGKYGNVYIVRHKKSGMMLALKKLNKSQIDQGMIKQITHEIKIQEMMEHPNIVKLITYFHDKDCLFLLLELFTSGHLYEFVQKKVYVQEHITKNIVKQICAGLLHLHRNNIIHRDVKLENVLYQMGMVKICDFGWSVETEDLRETFCGTPLYIAPEILLQKGYDRKIDVWCVGILTFELLFGNVPFPIKQQKDFMKIVTQQVNFPSAPAISKSAQNFIIKCLMKDPQLRPNCDQLLIHPFLQKCDYLKSNVDLF